MKQSVCVLRYATVLRNRGISILRGVSRRMFFYESMHKTLYIKKQL